MKIVSTSYSKTPEFDRPEDWLRKISFYTGILEELAKHHEVISIERINYEGECMQNGVHYNFRKIRGKTAVFPLRMHRFIKKLRPDVIFVNGLIFPLQVIQLRASVGKGVKIIVINRSEKPSKGLKGSLQRNADRHIDAYLFTSKEMAGEWVKQGIITDGKKIHDVLAASSTFNATDRTNAVAATGVQGSPVFLWVGRLDANKDPLTVVRAFLRFVKVQPTARLYMIYQSHELLHEIKQLLKESGHEHAVIMVGAIAHEELQNWYNAADFIISASHFEVGGIAVAEAMSCGCIPILTRILSFQRMTGPGNCGLLYEVGSDDELFSCLLKCREMDVEKERARALRQFKSELSFEAIAHKMEQILSSLNQG